MKHAVLFSLPAFFAAGLFAADWPSFRGPAASGVADGQKLPDQWDGVKGTNIQWKTAIPGLAHSSPIVWGDRIFVTTAVSSRTDATFKPGLYGEGTASQDNSVHQWKVICLDRKTGKVLWDRTAYEGAPKEKRHIKSTYASSTPATDGRVVVALFGSQGLYAYDLSGKLLWKKDLGRIDAGAYDLPEYEWGTASSPIIYRDLVIVQCDQQKGSFLLAADVKTGATVWRTERDELPSWATPNVFPAPDRPELVTNAPNRIRGYDPMTGKQLWDLGGSSKITAPTPIFSKDMVFVASGRRPEAPIFALRRRGGKWPGTKSSAALTCRRRSSTASIFMCSAMPGSSTATTRPSGEDIYRGRIPHQGSGFSASPVASDGKLYLSSEDGDMFVVQTGKEFKVLATCPMGEPLMATPALAGGTMFVRGQHHLFAVGR